MKAETTMDYQTLTEKTKAKIIAHLARKPGTQATIGQLSSEITDITFDVAIDFLVDEGIVCESRGVCVLSDDIA